MKNTNWSFNILMIFHEFSLLNFLSSCRHFILFSILKIIHFLKLEKFWRIENSKTVRRKKYPVLQKISTFCQKYPLCVENIHFLMKMTIFVENIKFSSKISFFVENFHFLSKIYNFWKSKLQLFKIKWPHFQNWQFS